MRIITDEYGNEYEALTYCDIYSCKECPRCGDDCDGEMDEEENE